MKATENMTRIDDDVHENETYEARRNPVMDDGTGDDEREISGVAKRKGAQQAS